MKNLKYLQAWINGQTIEVRDHEDKWTPLNPIEECSSSYSFWDNCEYRIAPKKYIEYFNGGELTLEQHYLHTANCEIHYRSADMNEWEPVLMGEKNTWRVSNSDYHFRVTYYE